jgi:hypothetical protein
VLQPSRVHRVFLFVANAAQRPVGEAHFVAGDDEIQSVSACPGKHNVTTEERVHLTTYGHGIRPVTLMAAVFLASTGTADACFCGPTCAAGPGSSVFEATVTAIGSSREPGLTGPDVVSLADVTVIAGAKPDALVQTASSCDYVFRVGVRYRIEGAALDSSGGAKRVWASQCGATRPLWTWDLRSWPTVVSWWWSRGACRS